MKQTRFTGNLVIVGFGSIGQGVLPLVLRHIRSPREKMVVVAPDDSDRGLAERQGVRFEKRALTLYDYALDRDDAGTDGASIIPVTQFSARPLEVPAGAEPLRLAAEHFVEGIRTGTDPLSSGRRSLRVVEVLEAADRAATRGGTAP